MLELLQKNWFIIGALGAVLAFIIEKAITYIKDYKNKQNSYNRLFTGVVKLYISYVRNSNLYSENPLHEIFGEYLKPIFDEADTFNFDLQQYKETINNESEILPEISVQANELFDILQSIELIDKLTKKLSPNGEVDAKTSIGVKKAYYYAVSETIESYFKDTLKTLKKKVKVSQKFYDRVYSLNGNSERDEQNEFRFEIMQKYFHSLVSQELIPVEIVNALNEELNNKKKLK